MWLRHANTSPQPALLSSHALPAYAVPSRQRPDFLDSSGRLEIAREAHAESPWLDGNDVGLSTAYRHGALGVTIKFTAPVERIFQVQIQAPGALLEPGGQIHRTVTRQVTENFVCIHTQIRCPPAFEKYRPLQIGIVAVKVEIIARGEVAFNFCRVREPGTFRRGIREVRIAKLTVGNCVTGVISLAAVICRQLGVIHRNAGRQGQVVGSGPTNIGFDPADSRLVGIPDFRQSIRTHYGELKILPVFLKYGAIEQQVTIQPFGLPAKLVVGKEIRFVRRQRTAAVDAARTETLRPGGIDHLVAVEPVGQIGTTDRIGLARALVKVHARRALERMRIKTRRLAGRTAVTGAKTEKTYQTVFGMEVAPAKRGGQLISQVVRHFPEQCRIVI